MKLAKALILRADAQKKLASLREGVGSHCKVQEGTDPQEDPADLMKEAFGVIKELRNLAEKINHANANSTLPNGRTLTSAIAQRDELIQQHSLVQHAIKSVRHYDERYYGMSASTWVDIINVKKLRKQADDLARKIREINLSIQEANWQIELE